MQGAPAEGSDERAGLLAAVEGLRAELAMAAAYRPDKAVPAAPAAIRARIPFLDRDRAMDREGATAVQLVRDGVALAAAIKPRNALRSSAWTGCVPARTVGSERRGLTRRVAVVNVLTR